MFFSAAAPRDSGAVSESFVSGGDEGEGVGSAVEEDGTQASTGMFGSKWCPICLLFFTLLCMHSIFLQKARLVINPTTGLAGLSVR